MKYILKTLLITFLISIGTLSMAQHCQNYEDEVFGNYKMCELGDLQVIIAIDECKVSWEWADHDRNIQIYVPHVLAEEKGGVLYFTPREAGAIFLKEDGMSSQELPGVEFPVRFIDLDFQGFRDFLYNKFSACGSRVMVWSP